MCTKNLGNFPANQNIPLDVNAWSNDTYNIILQWGDSETATIPVSLSENDPISIPYSTTEHTLIPGMTYHASVQDNTNGWNMTFELDGTCASGVCNSTRFEVDSI